MKPAIVGMAGAMTRPADGSGFQGAAGTADRPNKGRMRAAWGSLHGPL